MKQEHTEKTEREKAAATLDELVWFAMECGREGCFPGWDEELVRSYLIFHLKQGTCAFVRECEVGPRTRRIVALGIGWQLNEAEIDEEFIKKPFHWQETNHRGDSFLICDLMAIERKAMAVVASEFQWRWPNWRRLKLFAIRRGRLVRYDGERLLSRMEAL